MLGIHVIIGLATLVVSASSAISPTQITIKTTPLLLIATILTGLGLVFVQPSISLTHLCVSGVALSLVAMSLRQVALRRFEAAA